MTKSTESGAQVNSDLTPIVQAKKLLSEYQKVHPEADLYDFFMEQGILINIYHNDKKPVIFKAIITNGDEKLCIESESRNALEEKAFQKCFEMIESKILIET